MIQFIHHLIELAAVPFAKMLATDWKYVAVFLSGLIEGTPILGALYPGGTISFLIGSYAETGVFSPWIAMFLLIIGNFIGDMLGYGLGRYGHHFGFIRKILDKERFTHAWEIFDTKLFYFVVLGRLIPVVRSIPSLLAGARLIPVGRYVWYSLGGSVLWGFVGIWGGFLARKIIGPHAWLAIIGITMIAVIWGAVKKIANTK